jgi:membrane-bound lytic murein transglycosylase B
MRTMRGWFAAAVLGPLCLALQPGGALADDVVVDPGAVEAARGAFVERMVEKHGFDRAKLDAVLAEAQILPDVLRAISRPAERVIPWYEYRDIFLNDERIDAGARFWRDHADLIAEAAAEHQVDAEVIVAILGVETLFGQRMGHYRVLDALATLAFAYPPRASFFAGELEQFLLMSREEGDGVLQAEGSYAGAMGAGQFIPSSFRAYAVDADGDGRRDVWADWADVLGSVANYFHVHGWRAGEPIAEPAVHASGPPPSAVGNGLTLNETAASLAAKGYVLSADVPGSAPATVFALERDENSSEYWVGFRNFEVITRYNRSVKYALAAYQLSRAIREAYEASSGSDTR